MVGKGDDLEIESHGEDESVDAYVSTERPTTIA